MNNYKLFRKYEKEPVRVMVVHGGPGAPGSMQPLAERISGYTSVLEPFQTKDTIAGQVAELHDLIKKN